MIKTCLFLKLPPPFCVADSSHLRAAIVQAGPPPRPILRHDVIGFAYSIVLLGLLQISGALVDVGFIYQDLGVKGKDLGLSSGNSKLITCICVYIIHMHLFTYIHAFFSEIHT